LAQSDRVQEHTLMDFNWYMIGGLAALVVILLVIRAKQKKS
jgi:hypothetical protein